MIKNILYKFCCATIALVALSSCSEDEFTTFNGQKSGLYIARVSMSDINKNPIEFSDSTTLSFASYGSDVKELNVPVTVNVMGNISDKDRSFVLKIDDTKSTAVRGTDFDFKEADCFIPAGAASTQVNITINRTADLSSITKRIELIIEDNENFTTELESFKNTPSWNASGKQICGTRYKIIYNELYSETIWWTWSGSEYFGTWSASKEKRLNALMGWTHQEWDDWDVPYGRMPFAAKMLKKQLQEAADAGNPVIDDDGSYMQLPSPYEVDYSAYN